MFSNFDIQTKQMLSGNIMLVVCCLFYLAWWVVAFKPVGAIKGMKSGWLLIPAFLFGLLAVVWIIRGCSSLGDRDTLFPSFAVLLAGIIAYIVLLIVTNLLMHRQVTSELLLIVGWTVLMFIEVNALFAMGHYTQPAAIAMLIITVIAAIISLVCYLLYYNLDGVKGFIDGCIPLVMIGIMMIVTTISAAISP